MIRGHRAWLAALAVLCARAQAADVTAQVVTPAGQPVMDAAVVLEPLSGIMPGDRPTATIAQRDRELIPYVTIVQTGTAIEFPNYDPFKHHLYSFSPAKTFEIKLYVGKPAQPVIFDKAGEVAMGCNIHDWMEAYVLVVDSPFFARTGANGQALIAGVPPGRYRLRLWHPRQKKAPPLREVEIDAAPERINLVTDISARLVKPKPPADKDQY